MNTELKKVNINLVFVYGIAPIVLAALAALVVESPYANTTLGTQIAMFILVLFIGYFFTVILIPQIIFSASAKKFKKFCNSNGCQFDYYFYGNTTYVAVDTERRTMGVLFKLNPTSPYVFSLDEVTDAAVNHSVEPLSIATRGVSFSFHVDGKLWKVYTYSASTAYELETKQVKEAIEKAEKIVAVINGECSE